MSLERTLAFAIRFAATAHEGQDDKAGRPYILHPLRVMFRMETDEERIVAVLHDVAEDTLHSVSSIRVYFGGQIADAVDALTRRPGETYAAFIERVRQHPLARKVKLADLADNMDPARALPGTDGKPFSRYVRAKARLEEA